ncbi:MAG TPA: cation:proton antiporter, partial [Oligoflexia bacterium]|nr:cation:proton antiporter [Oligoflexia bacterium]
MESWVLLLDIVQLLGLSLVFGAVCARFGQSSLVGCLLAGMILGPRGINVISSASSVEQISEIGIALLLFSLGLDFSLPRLIGLGIRSVLCGILQVVLTLAAAALVGWIAGLSRWEAITAGAMIALSSTAAVLQVLMDHGELDSPHGRVSLAVLLIQDLAVIPLALLLSFAAAHQNTEQLAASSLITAAAAAAFITLLYFVMNKGVKTALRGFARERNRDLSILLAFVAGLGAAWGAHRIGI